MSELTCSILTHEFKMCIKSAIPAHDYLSCKNEKNLPMHHANNVNPHETNSDFQSKVLTFSVIYMRLKSHAFTLPLECKDKHLSC